MEKLKKRKIKKKKEEKEDVKKTSDQETDYKSINDAPSDSFNSNIKFEDKTPECYGNATCLGKKILLKEKRKKRKKEKRNVEETSDQETDYKSINDAPSDSFNSNIKFEDKTPECYGNAACLGKKILLKEKRKKRKKEKRNVEETSDQKTGHKNISDVSSNSLKSHVNFEDKTPECYSNRTYLAEKILLKEKRKKEKKEKRDMEEMSSQEMDHKNINDASSDSFKLNVSFKGKTPESYNDASDLVEKMLFKEKRKEEKEEKRDMEEMSDQETDNENINDASSDSFQLNANSEDKTPECYSDEKEKKRDMEKTSDQKPDHKNINDTSSDSDDAFKTNFKFDDDTPECNSDITYLAKKMRSRERLSDNDARVINKLERSSI